MFIMLGGGVRMTDKEQRSYLFNVELLVEAEHHAHALQQLIKQLNDGKFIDYKITSGIELGNILEERKANAKSTKQIPVTVEPTEEKQRSSEPAPPVNKKRAENPPSEFQHSLETFHKCKSENRLIRLIVNRGLGITLSIPCRVINVDENDLIIAVYHVDEKQVYTFRLIEIEDIIGAN